MYSLTFITLAASVGVAQADFYFGVISGAMVDGGINTPSLESYSSEVIVIGDQSICDADTFGGDPDSPSTDPHASWINWCGQAINNKDVNLILNPDDDCGDNVEGHDTVDDGTFYADVWDMDNDNKTVGRCVFEQGGNEENCAGNGSQLGSTSIHCYTDALS